jgi:hypothetical protein
VIDDFAHHPTAVEETLKALKTKYKGKRLIAVFEPRSWSSRLAVFQKNYEGIGYFDRLLLPENSLFSFQISKPLAFEQLRAFSFFWIVYKRVSFPQIHSSRC